MTLTLDGITHGGEAVGRLPDGNARFVLSPPLEPGGSQGGLSPPLEPGGS